MNVYMLLDRSYSMLSQWDEAIGSINTYAEGLPARTKVYLAAFDSFREGHQVTLGTPFLGGYQTLKTPASALSYVVMRDTTKSKWTDISPTEIKPRGGTPLYDAAGNLFNRAFADNPKRAVIVIMSDGEENSSSCFTREVIKNRVKEAEERGWQVIFLGANFDLIDTVSASLGGDLSKTMSVDVKNLRGSMATLSAYTATYGASGQAINFTDQDKIVAKSK